MNKSTAIAMSVVIAAALGAGYWLGNRNMLGSGTTPATQIAGSAPAKKVPKLLFYRNPMGLPDTSPVPKKDEMGMDYIPVYEGDEDGSPESAGQVKISPEKIQKLGVRSEAASLRDLTRSVHAVGRVEANERLTYTIAPKFEGWIERLHVNTTGQPVSKGQALLEVYSPELVSAQNEYAIAIQGQKSLQQGSSEAQAGMKQLAESSLARMKNWDISAEQLQALRKGSETRHTITFRSPANGIVMEKKAVQGMRFMPGEVLYQIADLSSVWIIADVFEQDLGLIKLGQTANVRVNAYPGQEFTAKVVFVYPTLNAQTRTIPVRLELANPGGMLKPAMFADIDLAVQGKGKVLTVPSSAVLRSGTHQTVLVELAEGRFEPREVKLGVQGNDYVEILEGLGEGEKVVTSANFLIDSESNLKAAFSNMTSGQEKPGTPPAPSSEHKGH
ncbi:RND family efflux transporter, MFP subunit [Sulfuricella denitrificans skB26]|uniref:RND family efflux transporter, MFP subunit n=1 Tax=Sulfuricella denitrificans (strain DSM 22764 / NBRC 105220 / skB26) TaxID=1163617 RepID=S6AAD4_SULDS|nr:efflux RND transporter periplasmic adaptor subunit [Sulfuricella denitrificans]BAN35665.1 RND family efflux transporter, MFP subunit [Sulfuricella denitrificans skB26]